MSLLRRVATDRRERRSWSGPSWLEKLVDRRLESSRAPIHVTERRAMQQTTVYSCVSLLSDTLAQLPIGSFEGVGGSRIPQPDPALLTEPTDRVEWPEWIGMAAYSMLLRGNTFGEIVDYGPRRMPRQVQLHHPDEVKLRLKNGRLLYFFPGRAEGTERYPIGDAWHVKGLTPPGIVNSTLGLSPIANAAATIGTALAAEEFGERWFLESAIPSGFLTSDQEIDENEAKDMKQRWDKAHGGGRRETAVMGNGLKYTTLSVPANESQFLETIKAKREEIAGFYRVPLHMLGMADKQSNWGTGVEEAALQFIEFTMGIWFVRFEKALSRLLPAGQYVKFNVSSLLRGRLIDRYNAYLIGRQGGWLSVDDIRALEEKPPLPDGAGESYSQPLNWGPLPKAGDQPVTEPAASAP